MAPTDAPPWSVPPSPLRPPRVFFPTFAGEHKQTYYVDPDTGETTWELPDKYAWEELKDLDSGNSYYHNKKTGETTWHKPEMLAWKAIPHQEL